MINVAFIRVHDVFQFVEKIMCDEFRMSAHDVICVYFHHVFAIQVASVTHVFQLVTNGLNGVVSVGAFF